MTLPNSTIAHMREYREGVQQREEAQRRAWDETVHRIERIREHIADQNIGLANEAIRVLLEDLPHDFGAQTFFPLFDRKLEEVRAPR